MIWWKSTITKPVFKRLQRNLYFKGFSFTLTDAFTQDVEQLRHLRQLLPRGKELLVLTEEGRTKGRRKEREGVYDKIFEAQDYEKIKEWLER